MTKDKTVTMSRELVRRAACNLTSSCDAYKIQQELLEALAAPVVERQEPVGEVTGLCYSYLYEGNQKPVVSFDKNRQWSKGEKLYTSPPAPVSVDERAAFEAAASRYSFMDTSDFVNGQYHGSDETQAAWELWQMRAAPVAVERHTMYSVMAAVTLTPTIPTLTSNQFHALAMELNACLDKVKEMNR